MPGNARAEQFVDAAGRTHINRIPQKPLNKYIKATLLTWLRRDDISIKNEIYASGNTLTVFDSNGKYLFSYDNAWDYGYYCIHMASSKEVEEPLLVAEMDWYENDLNTNSLQQDVFDVFDALDKKWKELQAIEEDRKSLTQDEIDALNALGRPK